MHILRNANESQHGTGISLDLERLVTGGNSLYQSLNLAILAGAKNIIMLGMDGKPAADGKSHFFGDHPRPTQAAAYPMYINSFKAAAKDIKSAGVRVINCSPGSAIDAFEKIELAEALNQVA